MTKQDLLEFLETDDFTYLDDKTYIGIFSNRDGKDVYTDSYSAVDKYSDDINDGVEAKKYADFTDLWDHFTVNGISLAEVLAQIKE